ncbi:Gfo/Idh/MocA family protein [Legionella waltersii]|uniref:Oxidoreductase n=1 Tax=Legionella waltersii TaxID=66969 RepID=A0A0W1ALC8_9GAMM|nr:Gfo/Idh/MocA family oxidoreductase [Legionella waltersii]KTD82156.1 oxidoreductase [Legionella waltersii]SNV10876.1 oxidoreductase [Legionella waltersii]
MSLNKVKWGILGTSFISQQMACAIAESTVGELTAIGSRDATKSRDFASQFSIPQVYNHYDDMLADPDLDVIYVGLPNHLHKEWTIKGLESGKHVLCEKPFALNEEEVKEMISSAKSSRLVCMEAIMYRCHPLIQEIKSLLQQKVIGDLRLFQAIYTAKIAHLANPVAGGAIYNLGCYPLSLVRYLSDANPMDLKAIGVSNSKHPHNDTRASAIVGFDDQSLATITVSDDLAMSWQFVVWGTEGRLEMVTNPWFPSVGDQVFRIYSSDAIEPKEVRLTTPLSAYAYQINTVNHLIQSPSSFLPEQITLQESLDNIRLLEQWRNLALM